MREVFDKHLFSHRVDQILQVLGRPVAPPAAVDLRGAAHQPGRADRARDLLGGPADPPAAAARDGRCTASTSTRSWCADKARMAGHPRRRGAARRPVATLGACINLGIAAADGELIAKMDDDNLYGEHYLSDLVRAFDYADAELVGKGAHYAYFEGHNTTMLRLPGLEHRYAFLVQGGTFLGKADMFRAYGFEPVNAGEDTHLVRRLQGGRRARSTPPTGSTSSTGAAPTPPCTPGRPTTQAHPQRAVLLRGPPRRPRDDLSPSAPLWAASCVVTRARFWSARPASSNSPAGVRPPGPPR